MGLARVRYVGRQSLGTDPVSRGKTVLHGEIILCITAITNWGRQIVRRTFDSGTCSRAAKFDQGIMGLIHPRLEGEAVFVEQKARSVQIEPWLMVFSKVHRARGADFIVIEFEFSIFPGGIYHTSDDIAFSVILCELQPVNSNNTLDVHQTVDYV